MPNPTSRFNSFTKQVEFYNPETKTWSTTPYVGPTGFDYSKLRFQTPLVNPNEDGSYTDYSKLTFQVPPIDDNEYLNDPFKGYKPEQTVPYPELVFQPSPINPSEVDPFLNNRAPQNIPTGQQFVKPTTLEELDNMVKSGQITDKNMIDQLEVEISNAPYSSTRSKWDGIIPGEDGSPDTNSSTNNQKFPWLPALNFAGSDLSTEAYSLGMRLGQKQGTPGKTLGIVGSAGAFTLGAARDLLAGLSTQRANNWMTDWYEKNKNKSNYTADEQYRDDNYLGGLQKRDGGYIFQEGGVSKSDVGYRAPMDGSTMRKDQQAAMALFKNQYGDVNYFADQYNKLRAEMEESYAENPYFVDADGNLVKRTIDPDNLQHNYVSKQESRRMARDLNRLIRKNDLPYQKIQHDAFYNPEGEQQKTASFEEGGYVVGQEVEFEYGGEVVKGTIKKIENGQIYL